jgi:hypothetical protein
MPEPRELAGGDVQVWRDNSGVPCAYSYTHVGRYCVHLPGVASFSYRPGEDWVDAAGYEHGDIYLVRDSYRRVVLPLLMPALGREVLHASAVLLPEGVIGLCAPSGTGKSTTAYGLARLGYPLWADDVLAWESEDISEPQVSAPSAVSMPFSIRLSSEAQSYFEESGQGTAAPLDLPLPPTAPLRALCLLERTMLGEEARAVRLTPAEAFPAILAHAYFFSMQDEERIRRMLENYLTLGSQVPVFRVSAGSGLGQLPAALDCILGVVRARAEAVTA